MCFEQIDLCPQIFNNINGITRDRLGDDVKMSRSSDDDEGREMAAQSLSMSMAGAPHSSTEPKVARPSLGVDDTEFGRQIHRTPSPTFSSGNRADYTANLSPTLKALYPSGDQAGTEKGPRHSSRRSFGSKRDPVQPFIHRNSAITRTDLIASAEVIYAKYLLGGAEKEIYLPPALRIHDFPLSADRLPHESSPEYDLESEAIARVPDLYHAQKVHFKQSRSRYLYRHGLN